MTQKAATMAMKISVVWTMGSGMPIVVRRSGGHRGRLGCGRGGSGGRRAGAALQQRCDTSVWLRNRARMSSDAGLDEKPGVG